MELCPNSGLRKFRYHHRMLIVQRVVDNARQWPGFVDHACSGQRAMHAQLHFVCYMSFCHKIEQTEKVLCVCLRLMSIFITEI